MDFLISDTSKVSYDRFLAGFTTQQATFTSKNTLPERSCYYIFIDKIPFTILLLCGLYGSVSYLESGQWDFLFFGVNFETFPCLSIA